MVDVLPPVGAYPKWEVNGTATEGYITISVMQSGSIFVKQEMKSGAKTLLKTLQAINSAVTIKEEPMDEDDPDSTNHSSAKSSTATSASDSPTNTNTSDNEELDKKTMPLCAIRINLHKGGIELFTDTSMKEQDAQPIEPVSMWPNLRAAANNSMLYPGAYVQPLPTAPLPLDIAYTTLTADGLVGQQPLIIEPKQEMKFVCEQCKVPFDTKEWLDIHICSKEKKREYVCTLCNAKYKSAKLLETHISKFHQPKEPEKPKKATAEKSSVPEPSAELLAALNPTYECEVCQKQYSWKQELQKHVETEHKVFNMKHVCKHCKKQFDSAAQLEAHLAVCVVLECELCKLMFPSKRDRDKHWVENHDIRFKCTKCKRSFKSQYDLDKHMKEHPSKVCEFCGREFAFKCLLKQHLQTVHKKEINFQGPTMKIPCEKCGKAYKDKGSLNEHMVAEHDLPGNFNCEQCGRQFWTKYRLDMHVRTHSGERPYMCNICGKSFTLSSSLYVHSKTHEDSDGLHECEICGKEFTHSYNLKKHMRLHDASRQCECRICGKTLKNKESRKSHELAHKDERKFKCNICGVAYNHSGSLHTHKKKHKENQDGTDPMHFE